MTEHPASTQRDRVAAQYDRIAARYDEIHAHLPYPHSAVDTLARLTGRGRALELGVGTGRVALPLAALGVEVHGVDASEAMVAELRRKPGGLDIPVTMGDFAEFSLDARYDLVFVVFNTFFSLPSQEAQMRCFGTAARHLSEDGVFVIEAFVPNVARLARGKEVSADIHGDHGPPPRSGVRRQRAAGKRASPLHQRVRHRDVPCGAPATPGRRSWT